MNPTPAVAPLSAEQLDNLEALLNAATPENWSVGETYVDQYDDCSGAPETVIRGLDGEVGIAVALDFGPNNPTWREANAAFIVATKNSMGSLIAQARAAQQAGAAAPSAAEAIATIARGDDEPDEDPPGIFTRDEVADMLECELITDSGMRTLRDGDSLKFNLEELAILVNHAADRVQKFPATPQSQVATYTAGIDVLNAEELAALRRFDECAQDGEGYDVPKAMMRRLSEIGVVQRLSGAYYHVTEYGMRVLGNAPVATAAPARDAEDAQTQAARDVLAERRRQVEKEGWTPGFDDSYKNLELNRAAVCYLSFGQDRVPSTWPWSGEWWKPTSYRRNMVKAGALILAEIERLDRAAMSASQKEGE